MPQVLHVRVISPGDITDSLLQLLDDEPTIANLVAARGVARRMDGDLLMFDLPREAANRALDRIRALGVEEKGSIALQEQETVLSKAAEEAERRAPGRPSDGVIWDAIEAKAFEDSRMSWSFVAFLLLATLIAGTGRYLDQPILIVGAMVVGPEFAPVSAICFGLARGRLHLLPAAIRTLLGGFVLAIAAAMCVWWLAYVLGGIERQGAVTGPQTEFILRPDVWSFLVALLAGTAGVLSLTAAKSASLVGVFISVTTVPAAGAIALTMAVGLWSETLSSLVQLGVNLSGMILAGTVTLVIQRVIWERVLPGTARQAAR